MGFPFGGIYMVSLRTQRPYSFFVAEGVIEDIAILQADDDPRFFIWFAISKADKLVNVYCYEIHFCFSEVTPSLFLDSTKIVT